MPNTRAATPVFDVDTSEFQVRVIDRSRAVPVVVDFWATWCAPCRTLGPTLERAVLARAGAVELAKVDTDRNPDLAQAFGIRGIPAVKAFRDGRVVAEFVGAQPAPMVERFLDRVVPSEADRLAAGGSEADLRQALEADPSHVGARRQLAYLLLRDGRPADALEVAKAAPHDRLCDGYAAWAELAQPVGDDPEVESLIEKLAADDWAEASEGAIALVRARAGAVRDQARRVAILCLEQLGPADPRTAAGRQQLAAALY